MAIVLVRRSQSKLGIGRVWRVEHQVGRLRYDFPLLIGNTVTGREHVSEAEALRRPQPALPIALADLRVDFRVAQTSLTELLLFEFPRNQRMLLLPVQIAYWLNLSGYGTGHEARESI